MSEDKTLDDIFGDSNEFVSATNTASSIESKAVNINVSDTVPSIANTSLQDDVPSLIGAGYPPEYIEIIERVKKQYRFLPKLNYDNLYKELAELSIKCSPTPTLQTLNDELYKVQAAKDRLSDILMTVIQNYNFKKRVVDVIKDSWGKFTEEKNVEGRKGDATFRLSNFLLDFAETEALSKACDHIFKNLDSIHESLSRRITIWQLIMKLQDVGRGAMPNIDFDRPIKSNNVDLFGENAEENSKDGGENKPKGYEF
jgi:hypothetical protein